MKLRATLAAAALLVGVAAASSYAHEGHDQRPGATHFDLEIKITTTAQGGTAPAGVADRFGNQFATARKDTEPASPDDRGTGARAGSWRWWSPDHGKTWQNLPGLPLGVDSSQPGVGGDVAVDGRDRVYAVDTYGGDLAFFRYTTSGPGQVSYDAALPALRIGGSVGRPRLVAHGDGELLLVTEQLVGTRAYVSRDAGQTWSLPPGVAFGSYTRCTPAADPKSAWLYVACSDDSTATVYRSNDGGATWTPKRVDLGDGITGAIPEAPALAVGADGRVHIAVLSEALNEDLIGLRSSRDHGATWTRTPRALNDISGVFRRVALTAAPDGRLGVVAYYREAPQFAWEVVASVFNPDRGPGPLLISFAKHSPVTAAGAAEPPGERLGASFDNESRMGILWTEQNNDVPEQAQDSVARDVWFVRTQNGIPPGTKFEEERTPTGALPDCRVKGQVVQVGEWQRIRKPTFRVRNLGSADRISAYALSGLDPARMWVTNGTSILKSEDAGCTWTEVWSLEPTASNGVTAANARITRLFAPGSRLALRHLWVQVEESVSGGGIRPHVVRTRNGEIDGFTFIDSGLPQVGRPSDLSVSSTNTDFAYVLVDDGTGQHKVLYASPDGQTWQVRGPVLEQVQGAAVDLMTLDPFVPNSVWQVVDGVLRHSTDGGRTWDGPAPSAAQSQEAGPITAVDVFHVGGSEISVIAFGAPVGGVVHTLRSGDGGKSWTVDVARGIEAPVDSIAHGSAPNILLASTAPVDGSQPEVHYLHLGDGEWDRATPDGITEPFRVSADLRFRPTFYGMSSVALWRYAGSRIQPGGPAPNPIGPAFTDPNRPNPVGTFSPRELTLSLGPGESRTVDLDLTVPARPRRVDLFFVFDTSESMVDDLEQLRSSFKRTVQQLQADGVDLWAGLAVYRTEGDPPRYERRYDIGPLEGFIAALDAVKATGGSGNETQLIALEQALTGKGEPAVTSPVGSTCDLAPETQGCSIKAGQQADFRASALHVVVHATDSPFRNPPGTRQNSQGRPDIAGVAADYAARGVHVIGLAAKSPNEQEEGPQYEDLRLMSSVAGTLAGPGGADCGDPRGMRVAAGQPLVCPMSGSSPANTVLSLLRAQPSLAVVSTTVLDPARIAFGGIVTDRVDLAAPRRLSRQVTVTCPADEPGDKLVTVQARVDGGPVAESRIAVSCSAVPLVPRPSIVTPIVPPLVPNPVPPPVPANPVPGTQVQSQVQAQVQAQVQLGAVGQDQEQVQLALAAAGELKPDEDSVTQLAMSRRDEQERAAKAVLAAALIAASVVGAVGYRRRFATTSVAARVVAD